MTQARNKRKANQRLSQSTKGSADSQDVMKQLDKLTTNTRREHSKLASQSNNSTKIVAFVAIIIVGLSGIVILSQINFTGSHPNTNPSTPDVSIVASLGNFKQDQVATPHFINGKLSIVFVSGEFCPYCAVERWAIVMALSQYGSFSNLQYITSSENNVPTYTFVGSTFTSDVIEFLPAEIADNNNQPLESMTPLQSGLFDKYNSYSSIPFLCLGGSIFQVGSGSSLKLSSFADGSVSDITSQITSKSGTLYAQIYSESVIITTLIKQLLATQSTTSPSSTL